MKNSLLPLCVVVLAAALTPGCSTPQVGAPAPSNSTANVHVYDQAELSTRPKLVKHGPPAFPFELKRKGVSGKVTLSCVIDRNGRAREIHVDQQTHPAFASAAIDALEGWRWEPGKKDGQPVACRAVIPINFDITRN